MVYQPEGNFYDKYNSRNIIVKKLMEGFFSSMQGILAGISYQTVLEAGCGEGHVSNFLYKNKKGVQFDAFDVSEKVIRQAQKDYPHIHFRTGSIYDIDCEDNTYDLVVASEVLEHLEEPQKALEELFRVSKKYVFISVPNEPIWRILNMLRGKYWRNLGNTPGHVNHWGKHTFMEQFVSGGGVAARCDPNSTPVDYGSTAKRIRGRAYSGRLIVNE